MDMRRLTHAVVVLTCLVVVPSWSFAQSSITGVVRDTSGAVLPGVSVEASSDVLIEKVRSAVTDDTGQYRITELRPGTYTVTFTLTGFSTVKREQLELPADFVSTVNADLRVGTLEETVTVTGESPIVDVQSARRRRTLDENLIEAIPTAQGYAAVMVLMPSMVQSNGGNNNVLLSPGMIVFGGRGGRGNEGIAQTDGIGTGAAINGGGVSGYGRLDTTEEVVLTASGGLGDVEVGGPIVNLIPRNGSNRFENRFQASGLSGGMQGDNFTDELRQAGLRTPAKTNYQWDSSLMNSGPIMRDRLWFFYATRYSGSGSDQPGIFFNKNAGDITKWTYDPDFNRPARNSSSGSINPTLRLTAQVNRTTQVGVFLDAGGFRLSDYPQIGQVGAVPLATPETGTVGGSGRSPMFQYKWTWTATSRLLLDASYGSYHQDWNGRERPDNNRDLIRMTEQCTAGCANNGGGIPGLVYRAQVWNPDYMEPNRWQAAATYVTGAHNMKAGYQGVFHWQQTHPHGNNYNLDYRVNNGIPNQLTQFARPYFTDSRVRYDALYAQDQWTHGRFTVQGAVRYDHAWSYYPAQQIGPTQFIPNALVFPESKGVIGYHDIDPRFGLAYDVFGNGKTALKFNTGRYLEAAVNGNGNYSALQPSNRVPTSVTRSWTDANRNFTPDCDLLNGEAQDLRASGGDSCGRWNNLNFGKNVYSLSYDDNILKGWYNRPSDWQIGVTAQHEVIPRVSMEVSYLRRWLQNFTVTDNRALAPEDFTQFNVVTPLDPRLPGGGGYTVGPIYDVNPAKFGLTENFRTYSPEYGNVSQVYNGVDVSVNARLRNGLQVQAGTSTGQTVVDACEVRDKLPEQVSTGAASAGGIPYNPANPYCHIAPGITTRFTSAGSYIVPKLDVQVAFTLTSSPGVPLEANWIIPNATARQWLGRDLAGSAPNISVNLLAPDQMRSDRINILDFRIGKVMRFGGQRALFALDLFNALNLDTVLVNNFQYDPQGSWLVPQEVLTARTAKITVQYDF
jgi:Carboxypeptidase regulatory-like domain